jgi:prepilin signal peptidase PulO-like enzyme (type II secretory pathway)
MILEAVLWGGFGLIFGSFTNVLILRHGTGRGLDGRSSCMRCKKQLEWYELIPLLSWIALRGKCGHCGARISVQYPLVEALSAAGFLLLGFSSVPLVFKIAGGAIVVLFLAIAVYDLREMIMPDRWVWSFDILAFAISAYLLFSVSSDILPYAMLAIAGPAVALPLFGMWYLSDGKWMGFGDVKFALGMGWLLGIGYGYLALMFSFVIGALVGVFILMPLPRILQTLHRIGITRLGEGRAGFTMKSEVPFGPFLILGTCIVWFALIYSNAPILGFPGVLLWWS